MSKVYLAKDKKTQAQFASNLFDLPLIYTQEVLFIALTHFLVKECNKTQIVRENKVKYVHLEKRILAEYLKNHPFFIKLCFTFQTEEHLCKKKQLIKLLNIYKF